MAEAVASSILRFVTDKLGNQKSDERTSWDKELKNLGGEHSFHNPRRASGADSFLRWTMHGRNDNYEATYGMDSGSFLRSGVRGKQSSRDDHVASTMGADELAPRSLVLSEGRLLVVVVREKSIRAWRKVTKIPPPPR
ncbi:hypothetical protein BHM03_00028924 [Ensete ventricosum]|nr:hypothetical protein BHM03_00028924 [Ensete ventricosum]